MKLSPAELILMITTTLVCFLFLACKGDAAETANHSDVESKIVPPSCVVWFVETDIRVKQVPDQRNWRDPAVPDAPEKACGLIGGVFAIARYASGKRDECCQ